MSQRGPDVLLRNTGWVETGCALCEERCSPPAMCGMSGSAGGCVEMVVGRGGGGKIHGNL